MLTASQALWIRCTFPGMSSREHLKETKKTIYNKAWRSGRRSGGFRHGWGRQEVTERETEQRILRTGAGAA